MFRPSVPTVPATAVTAQTYLLDVREDDEWADGHVQGAVHLPMSELVARLPEVRSDCQVVVMCAVGARSGQVVSWLVAQGYDAVNLAGGVSGWLAAGRPLVRD